MASKSQKERGYLLPEHITGHDLICVSMKIPNDEHYKAAFFGAITELGKWWNWEKSNTGEDRRATTAAAYWRDLIFRYYKVGDCGFDDDRTRCVDYPMNSKIVEFAPMDPFLQPGYIPDGYISPAWGVVGQSILNIVGLQPTDVVTGWTGLPVTTPAIGQGLARFRVRAKGQGTIALHLLAIPFGGSVLIVPDGTLNPTKWVFLELERDLASIPPETVTVLIQEVAFDEPGEHYLDVTFMPRFNDAVTFIGYGGGIRKVVLCGMVPVDAPEQEGTIGSDSSGVEIDEMARIRVKPTDCTILQIECSPDEWSDFYNPLGCADGSSHQPAPEGELQAGQCKTWKVELSGSQKWQAPIPVQAGYQVTVTEAKGGWNDGGRLGFYCPDGSDYLLGQCIPNSSNDPADPLPTAPHMSLVCSVGTVFRAAYNTSFTIPAGTEQTSLTFQANDSDTANNYGSITFTVQVCATSQSDEFVPENVTVSIATGATSQMAQFTKATKVYRLTITGVGDWINPDLPCDAFWVAQNPDFDASHYRPNPPLAEIWRNGAPITPTPDYRSDHTYTVDIQGDGQKWSFNYHDTDYFDNGGNLNVHIVEL